MTDTPDRAEIIALPPLIFAGFLIAGLLASWLHPLPWLSDPRLAHIGWLLIALVAVIATSAIRTMKARQTTVNPRGATTAIVEAGPFRYTRNPLYLSLALLNLAASCLADSAIILGLTPVLMLVLQFGVILPEERYLERKFGDDYLRYKVRVRRWL